MKIYDHYNEYPMSQWRWPSFTPREMACRGDADLAINEDAMNKLQALRNLLGKPLVINSAYRSPTYNKRIGGARASKHMKAVAFDVAMYNHNPAEFEAAARKVGFTGFGFYQASNFIHIDTGRNRAWGKRWFTRADFAEPVPVRKPIVVTSTPKPPAKPKINTPQRVHPRIGGIALLAAGVASAGLYFKETILNWFGG